MAPWRRASETKLSNTGTPPPLTTQFTQRRWRLSAAFALVVECRVPPFPLRMPFVPCAVCPRSPSCVYKPQHHRVPVAREPVAASTRPPRPPTSTPPPSRATAGPRGQVFRGMAAAAIARQAAA
eukprot:959349-Prymnesium_polylepis.1